MINNKRKLFEKGFAATGLLIIAGVAALAILSKSRQEDTGEADTVLNEVNPSENDPRRFGEEEVVLEGTILNVISDRSFTVKSPSLIRDELLVIVKEPLNVDELKLHKETSNGRIIATGTIERFELGITDKDLNLNLGSDVMEKFNEDPYVLANKVTILQ